MNVLKKTFCLFFLAVVTGCGGEQNFNPPIVLQHINVRADDDANDGEATKIDVVIVYDQALFDKLLGMKAAEYFSQHEQLADDHKGTMQVINFEVVPGDIISDRQVNLQSNRAKGALVFASYNSPGEHRYRLQTAPTATILLHASSFEVKENVQVGFTDAIKQGFKWPF